MKSVLAHAVGALVLAAVLAACGGSSFVASDEGTGGTSGSSGGSTGGKGATGGSSGKGGSGTGGSSATGGSGGAGGSTGGSGGTVGGGGSGGSGTGGVGTGGTLGGSGGTGGTVGGNGGVGGSCGPCPLIACGPPFMAYVAATNGAPIADLKIEASFGVTCTPIGGEVCQWMCQSNDYQLPSGDYLVTFSAPGFDPSTVEFSVTSPGQCGCCGCPCSFGYNGQVALEGEGEVIGCCTDRQTDPNNCGQCGNVCSDGVCTAGLCPGATDCASLTTEEACEASSECHSVFVDNQDCDCTSIGCCAQFSRCAPGDFADCVGANVMCDAMTPYCENPAYVVSYSCFCYEGCVDPKDCAVATL